MSSHLVSIYHITIYHIISHITCYTRIPYTLSYVAYRHNIPYTIPRHYQHTPYHTICHTCHISISCTVPSHTTSCHVIYRTISCTHHITTYYTTQHNHRISHTYHIPYNVIYIPCVILYISIYCIIAHHIPIYQIYCSMHATTMYHIMPCHVPYTTHIPYTMQHSMYRAIPHHIIVHHALYTIPYMYHAIVIPFILSTICMSHHITDHIICRISHIITRYHN
ncbi:putative integral membrane protein [Brugia pahangi]